MGRNTGNSSLRVGVPGGRGVWHRIPWLDIYFLRGQDGLPPCSPEWEKGVGRGWEGRGQQQAGLG